MSDKNNGNSRREFLKSAGEFLLASSLGAPQTLLAQPSLPSPVGYAAISWPDDQFDDAITAISSLGFTASRRSAGLRRPTMEKPKRSKHA
jgi:hypothetical protein